MATQLFNMNSISQDNVGMSYGNQKPQVHTMKFQCNINQNGDYFPISHNDVFGNISPSDNKRRKKLGGQNKLVVIDSFPNGYTKFNENIRINCDDRIILGFAEITESSPKYHFKLLPNSENIQNLALDAIRRTVLSDSTIIIDDYFFDIYENLNTIFNTVVTVAMLERHNSMNQNVIENLKEIWHKAVETCDNVHDIEEVVLVLNSLCN